MSWVMLQSRKRCWSTKLLDREAEAGKKRSKQVPRTRDFGVDDTLYGFLSSQGKLTMHYIFLVHHKEV